ncbi:MAG: efflux RND transporter periplasmic adaptor subunit [Rhodocyclaceae bacterium]|nr:efflux RND transporter periplasmic adaptor subunit [Rhodocyclaceae bacterium]
MIRTSRLADGARSAAFAILAAGLTACTSEAQQSAPPAGPAEVRTITLRAEDLPLALEYPARVHGSREVEIRPRVGGILEKRNYVEGARVEAGQSLFSIDPQPYRNAAARAEADLAAARARVAQTRREVDRLAPLIRAKLASRRDLDNAESSLQIARAEQQGAEARLREARLNLEYTRVESPLTGIAGRALPSEGALLAGAETLLTRVSRIDPVHVLFGVPDNDQLRLQRGAASGELVLPADNRYEADIILADGSRYPLTGAVDFTSVLIDRSTGTSEVRAVVANPDGALRPGQFVRVRLRGAVRPNAVEVPQRAVLEGPEGRFVYVVEDGKAAMRPVETADWRGDAVAIRKGLAAGDRVIVDGVLKIGPGAPVTAAQAEQGG